MTQHATCKHCGQPIQNETGTLWTSYNEQGNYKAWCEDGKQQHEPKQVNEHRSV